MITRAINYFASHLSLFVFVREEFLKTTISQSQSVTRVVWLICDQVFKTFNKYFLTLKYPIMTFIKIYFILIAINIHQIYSDPQIISQNSNIFDAPQVNHDPIIGIMAIDMSYFIQSKYTEQYFSFIAASYVKFVEGGGARVVPVW